MSATASTMPLGGHAPRAVTDQRPSVARLTLVELRKMLNTRSGFWVPIAVGAITLLVAAISASNHGGTDGTLRHVLHDAAIPGVYLLPVMGVLLVCSEWSQRTALTTFTLVPSRWRVVGAKLGASLIASTVALGICLLCAVVCASAFGHAAGGVGGLPWQIIGQTWIELAAGMLMGLSFGAAILISAPAIVLFLLLPLVWNGLVNNISGLVNVARWIDSDLTFSPLSSEVLNTTQWAHALVTAAVWIGGPLAIGLLRLGRGDLD